jgi:hypothetical protein
MDYHYSNLMSLVEATVKRFKRDIRSGDGLIVRAAIEFFCESALYKALEDAIDAPDGFVLVGELLGPVPFQMRLF